MKSDADIKIDSLELPDFPMTFTWTPGLFSGYSSHPRNGQPYPGRLKRAEELDFWTR
jgi:hypothetical protein